ncbi:shugoshin-like protein [Elsinoe australis]|uniref:Shugoshin-like protein n=1 Tax=Elsinoe australis TaxID=40998 RepID=A0A4U7AW67_9PEZI|nr:shugoshin-like protein [Elsinoe australis]
MARLNEAPLQTESVEALKRRFIRQNRDLARINTHQSLRIRALEVEQSRLQSENLSLREEIIRLQNQLSDSSHNVQLSDLDVVRQDLQRRVEEILGVVSELGQLKKREQPKRQSNPSSWRPAIPNLRLAGPELRMPAIVEGKQYPRRTLDADEIRELRLSDQSNESPDLGPPPVAHFDYADPIKFDRPEPIEQSTGEAAEVEIIPAEMAINLETRRKRKDAQSKTLGDASSDETVGTKLVSKKGTAPRTSTKRKLSVCESEDLSTVQASEPFNFTRRSASAQELRQSDSTEALTSSPVKLDMTEWINEEVPKERKILGNKSVNMSPRKVVVGKPTEKPSLKGSAHDSHDIPKPRARRPKASSTLPFPVQAQPDPPVETIEPEKLPPKTPSADLFSPTSEPSSITSTLPHDATTSANLEGLDGTARPSRRVRAAVSYAEPSLNTKMRRPTKELVAAVYPAKAGDNNSATKRSSSAPLIKKEEEADGDQGWKDLAPSTSAGLRSPLLANSDVAESRIASPPSSTRSGSSTAIQALRRAERPKSVAEIRVGAGEKGLEDRMREMELEGFKDVEGGHRRVASAELRRTRRHSSIASVVEAEAASSSPRGKSSLENSPVLEQGMAERPGLARSTSQPLGLGGRSERLASRRRSMIV